MNRTNAALVLALVASPPLRAQSPPDLPPPLDSALHHYLLTHFRTPEGYVVEKFADHDVVLLGEFHRIRRDVELVQRLLPLLHRRGVRALGTEFARRADQPLIDSLLSQQEWDEELARTIQLHQFVAWGYREYVDVLRAAWALNRSLPPDAPRFRILGLNNAPDWSQVREPGDRDDPEVMRRVWRGETEEEWARPVVDWVRSGGKILLHTGIHHAFTRYHQPVVSDGELRRLNDTRAGNFLYRALGDRTFLVYLHALWPPREGYGGDYVRPADGLIDAFFRTLPPGLRRVGFDVRNTPFGTLPGSTSVYSHGYRDFTLATLVDGYIYQGPFCDAEGVTPIPDFIDARNLDFARRNSVNPAFRTATAERYNRAVAGAANLQPWCDRLAPWPGERR